MFIMVQIDIRTNTISILDTSDNKCETINLVMLAYRFTQSNLKVRGIYKLSDLDSRNSNISIESDAFKLPHYGIAISLLDAKKALCDYYVQNGMKKEEARSLVGLK